MTDAKDQIVSLYRYRPINEYLWQELELAEWFACRPSLLNDPFDCVVDPIKALNRVIAEDHIDAERANKLSVILDEFSESDPREKKRGIVCFSRVRDNHLMWSHYAGGHSGVCLAYEFPADYFSKKYNSPLPRDRFYQVGLASVQYGNDVYTEWLVKGNLDDPIPKEFVVNAAAQTIISKASSWSYEEEVRLIMSDEGLVSFPHDFLKEVTFGLRATEVHQRLIKKMVERNAPQAVFFKAIRGETSDFGLKFEQIRK